MDKPVFFLVAHVLVKHNGAKSQFANFQKLVPTSTDTNIVKSPTNPLYLTFVATFDTPVDFEDIKKKLPFTYGGKSKVLKVHYSTTDQPTYFYSTHMVHNFLSSQKMAGLPEQKHRLVQATLALITTSPKFEFFVQDSSILIENPNQDIRSEDILTLTRILNGVPHLSLHTSRETKGATDGK